MISHQYVFIYILSWHLIITKKLLSSVVGFLVQESYHPLHANIGGMAITHMASVLHIANSEGASAIFQMMCEKSTKSPILPYRRLLGMSKYFTLPCSESCRLILSNTWQASTLLLWDFYRVWDLISILVRTHAPSLWCMMLTVTVIFLLILIKINSLWLMSHLHYLSGIPLDYISVVLFLVSFEVFALRR